MSNKRWFETFPESIGYCPEILLPLIVIGVAVLFGVSHCMGCST